MKLNNFISYLPLFLLLFGIKANAQLSPLEFASGGGNTANGPSLFSAVTMYKNTDNATTGTTFVASPVTVTYSLTNLQYNVADFTVGSGNDGVLLGTTNSTPSPIYSLQQGTATDYTSAGSAAGSGISLTSNFQVTVSAYSGPLTTANVPFTGTVYVGDLELTFSEPVDNPHINFFGLGGGAGGAANAISADYEYLSSNVTGVTVSKVSGTSNFTVASNRVYNNSANQNTNRANGTAKFEGKGFTKIVLKIYLRASTQTGVTTAPANWSASTSTSDYTTLSISAMPSDSDGDGIADSDDLDDDNDGILDTVEGVCTNATTLNSGAWNVNGNTFDFTYTGSPSPLKATIVASSAASSLVGNFNPSGTNFWSDSLANASSAQSNFNIPSTITISFTDLAGNPVKINKPIIHFDRIGGSTGTTQNSARLILQNGLTWTRLAGTNDFFVSSTTVQDSGAGTATGAGYSAESTINDIDGTASGSLQINQSVDQIVINLVNASPAAVATVDGIELILKSCRDRDTDNDGIADYLDTDSDNDGCPDAKEGAADLTPTNTPPSTLSSGNSIAGSNLNLTTTAVSTAAATLGVPTVAGTGQAAGQAYDFGKNDCADNDGDGVPDWADLDDDNDGILDTNEFGSCTTVEITPAELGLTSNTALQNGSADISSKFGYPAGTVIISYTNANFGSVTTPATYNGGAARAWVVNNPSGTTLKETNFTVKSKVAFKLELNHGRVMNLIGSDDYFKILSSETYTKSFGALNPGYALISPVSPYDANDVGVNKGSTATAGQATVLATDAISFLSDNFIAQTSFIVGTTDNALTPANYWLEMCLAKDTDGDSVPDYLDTDSDNDGCADAVEGSEVINTAMIWPLNLPSTDVNYENRGRIKVIYDGATSSTQAGVISTATAALGVPQLVNPAGATNNFNSTTNSGSAVGIADNTDGSSEIGQGAGDAYDATKQVGCHCYKPAQQTGDVLPTPMGITSLGRAGSNNGNSSSGVQQDNWPMTRNGGWLALESKSKGFVLNRMPTATVASGTIKIGDPIK